MANAGRGQWEEMVAWCGQGSDGGGVVCLSACKGKEVGSKKNLTTKCSGLVLGVPWQMAVEGYREKWSVVWKRW